MGFRRNAAIAGAIGAGAVVGARRMLAWHPDPLDDLFGQRRTPLILGHRGASADAPENTLEAFQAAIDQGADGIELDAQVTADGAVVVVHDDTLDRTTNGHGAVGRSSLAYIRGLDAGSWFSEAFAGSRVPTLDEVLDLAKNQVIVNVELKTDSFGGDGLEQAVAASVRRLGMQRQVLLSSFNPMSLWRAWRVAPELPRGLLYTDRLPWYAWARRLAPLSHADALHPDKSLVTPEMVTSAHEHGHRVDVWTVDDPADLRRMAEAHVDAVISNGPGKARVLLDEYAANRR